MILSHESLLGYAKDHITPFEPSLVGPASIDLRLGSYIRYAKNPLFPIDKNTNPEDIWSLPIDFIHFILDPGDIVLCHSLENVSIPDYLCSKLFLTSSAGRLGIEHLHAGFGDPGFIGQWTFELYNPTKRKIRLVAGEIYCQMTLECLDIETDLSYRDTGRYNGQLGATTHRKKRVR